jgi:hypothetical protein
MLVSFLGRTVERTIYLGLGLLITTIMLVSIWHYMSLSMIDVSPHCVGRLRKKSLVGSNWIQHTTKIQRIHQNMLTARNR